MSAIISEDGVYRYRLERQWDTLTGAGTVLWIMLNPSTADAEKNDPTIRRCIGYSKAWGYAGLYVGNLYALRSTDPKAIGKHADPVGPECDHHLAMMVEPSHVSLVVCAWGSGADPRRVDQVCDLLQSYLRLHCLGFTKDGSPRHPLYLPKDLQPKFYGSARASSAVKP